MKCFFAGLSVLLACGTSAFAGTAMSVTNKPLGFVLSEYPQGNVASDICDSSGTCISFNYVKQLDSTTSLYREVSGKCEITVQTFDKSFRTGNTRNEFMLDLMAFIVKAIQGEDACMLHQADTSPTPSSPSTLRSLTGIYE